MPPSKLKPPILQKNTLSSLKIVETPIICRETFLMTFFARHRRGRWLNNRVEQDRRRIKRLTRPILGFQGFWTAKRTLAGIEAMAMLVKGQVRAVPRGDMPAQRAFVQQIFGIMA